MYNSVCAKNATTKKITQFELSNLIRKSRLFSKIKLAPSTRLVLESLVYHYPNIRVLSKTLQEETGCSQKSVENSLKELKEKGLILITHTGRSSIFNLTQKFFDLLEVAVQIPQKERSRSAEITLPHNKEKNKEIKKDFQKNTYYFSSSNEVKKQEVNFDSDKFKYKEHAKIYLSSFHRFNLKSEHDKAIIRALQDFWKFDIQKEFPALFEIGLR